MRIALYDYKYIVYDKIAAILLLSLFVNPALFLIIRTRSQLLERSYYEYNPLTNITTGENS